MDKILEIVGEHFGSILASLITGLVVWALSKLHLKAELRTTIELYTKRVVDKASEWLKMSTAPTSDGGSKITAAELSELRQFIWDMLMKELSGPMGSLLRAWGENKVKALIGLALEKIGIKATPEATPGAT